jgi:hypothetical protein
MAAPDTSAYLLTTGDQTDLAQSSVFTAGPGLTLTPSGAYPNTINTLAFASAGLVGQLNASSTPGFFAYETSGNLLVSRTLTPGTGIAITHQTGTGNPVFSVVPQSTLQNIQVQVGGGSLQTAGSFLNLIPGSGMSISATPGASNTTNVQFTSTASGGTLTAVDISSSSGINTSSTTTSGVVDLTVDLPGSGGSSAVDFGDLLVGGVAGQYAPLGIGTDGYILVADGGTAVWGPNNWYLTEAGNSVAMNNNVIDGASSVVSGNFVVTNGTQSQTLTPGTNNYIQFTNSSASITDHNVVTATPGGNYGVIGNLLVGNGNDYNPMSTMPTAVGERLTCTAVGPSVTLGWEPASTGTILAVGNVNLDSSGNATIVEPTVSGGSAVVAVTLLGPYPTVGAPIVTSLSAGQIQISSTTANSACQVLYIVFAGSS